MSGAVEIPVLYLISSDKQMDMLWGDIHHGVNEGRPVEGIKVGIEKRRAPINCPRVDPPEQGDRVLWDVGPRVETDEITLGQSIPMVGNLQLFLQHSCRLRI